MPASGVGKRLEGIGHQASALCSLARSLEITRRSRRLLAIRRQIIHIIHLANLLFGPLGLFMLDGKSPCRDRA